MYRIFCESYKNYINSFDKDNYRLKISEPFKLIVNIDIYKEEEKKQSETYKKLCDLIYYVQKNLERFPRLKAFLWTLEARNMKGKKYNVSYIEELEEQAKLINSFLKLAYWY